jgi:hypothetical protein
MMTVPTPTFLRGATMLGAGGLAGSSTPRARSAGHSPLLLIALKQKYIETRLRGFLMAFVATWIVGFVACVVEVSTDRSYEALLLVQALCLCLGGLFNSLAYGINARALWQLVPRCWEENAHVVKVLGSKPIHGAGLSQTRASQMGGAGGIRTGLTQGQQSSLNRASALVNQPYLGRASRSTRPAGYGSVLGGTHQHHLSNPAASSSAALSNGIPNFIRAHTSGDRAPLPYSPMTGAMQSPNAHAGAMPVARRAHSTAAVGEIDPHSPMMHHHPSSSTGSPMFMSAAGFVASLEASPLQGALRSQAFSSSTTTLSIQPDQSSSPALTHHHHHPMSSTQLDAVQRSPQTMYDGSSMHQDGVHGGESIDMTPLGSQRSGMMHAHMEGGMLSGAASAGTPVGGGSGSTSETPSRLDSRRNSDTVLHDPLTVMMAAAAQNSNTMTLPPLSASSLAVPSARIARQLAASTGRSASPHNSYPSSPLASSTRRTMVKPPAEAPLPPLMQQHRASQSNKSTPPGLSRVVTDELAMLDDNAAAASEQSPNSSPTAAAVASSIKQEHWAMEPFAVSSSNSPGDSTTASSVDASRRSSTRNLPKIDVSNPPPAATSTTFEYVYRSALPAIISPEPPDQGELSPEMEMRTTR